ncbi:hypothetical protein KRX19_01605 [Cardiobacteriaceae bacterium TAE3-ERU3]|nr:hypothetical protein [Cardiobacteriaceae bacterium TAE3-ERU3]
MNHHHPLRSVNALLNLRFKLAVATCLGLLCSASAYAHVKWFIDPNMPAPLDYVPYSWTEPYVLAWIAIGLCLIGASIFLDDKFPDPPIPTHRFRHDAIVILRVFTGMSFFLTAYDGNLIAPHMPAYGTFGMILLFLQGIIGLLFIADRFMFHAAALIFVLLLGVLIQYGFLSVLEYCNLIGIALFFMFNHMPSLALSEKYKPYSVDMLRIFTGIALATLGVTEKITGGALGQAFIAEYGWNFMQLAGFDFFDDRLFVLSAGVMEVIFGIILILGTTTRVNTLVVSSFMLASNTVFLVIGDNPSALMELVGHMPIIGSALILILLGYGQRLKITNLWRKKEQSGIAAH